MTLQTAWKRQAAKIADTELDIGDDGNIAPTKANARILTSAVVAAFQEAGFMSAAILFATMVHPHLQEDA